MTAGNLEEESPMLQNLWLQIFRSNLWVNRLDLRIGALRDY